MSKRSKMSRWQDLKRGFIDIGRYRYVFHKFDMERWRDYFCPECGGGFTEEPGFYFESKAIHDGCWETYLFKYE